MHARHRLVSAAAVFVLASAPATLFADPISLDNDVNIEWSQVGSDACRNFGLCPADVVITGAPRLVEDAANAGNDVFFDISVTSPSLFNGIFLSLFVGDTSLEELTDAAGNPLVLELAIFGAAFDTLFGLPPVGTVVTQRFTLADFADFNLLPQGVDVIFSLGGSFSGSSLAAGSNPPYGASIAVSGAGTRVPEPATLSLLLIGLGASTLTMRRR